MFRCIMAIGSGKSSTVILTRRLYIVHAYVRSRKKSIYTFTHGDSTCYCIMSAATNFLATKATKKNITPKKVFEMSTSQHFKHK